jgi:hypothetical protein
VASWPCNAVPPVTPIALSAEGRASGCASAPHLAPAPYRRTRPKGSPHDRLSCRSGRVIGTLTTSWRCRAPPQPARPIGGVRRRNLITHARTQPSLEPRRTAAYGWSSAADVASVVRGYPSRWRTSSHRVAPPIATAPGVTPRRPETVPRDERHGACAATGQADRCRPVGTSHARDPAGSTGSQVLNAASQLENEVRTVLL